MPGPTFQRRMSRLALVAMLLLLALPTLGRVAAAMAPVSGGIWVQLCTVEGLKPVLFDAATGLTGDAAPPAQPDGDATLAMDCDYCPLSGSLALFRAIALPQACAVARDASPASGGDAPSPLLLPGGPGSRGPPRRS